MIRLTYLLRRLPGMSDTEFKQYWREVHGPLAAGLAPALNIARYVQVHTLTDGGVTDTGPRGEMEKPYDGVEEMWWTSRNDLVSAMDSPQGQEAAAALLEDEATFIDLPVSPLWFAHEYPQINPSPENLVATDMSSIVKFYYPMRPASGLTIEKARQYWLTEHGPLIRRTGAAGHILRYLQVHRFDEPYESAFREARSTRVEPYMGHAELWFDRSAHAAGADAPERERARNLAFEDESRFIDFSRSCMWTAREHVFVDRLQQA